MHRQYITESLLKQNMVIVATRKSICEEMSISSVITETTKETWQKMCRSVRTPLLSRSVPKSPRWRKLFNCSNKKQKPSGPEGLQPPHKKAQSKLSSYKNEGNPSMRFACTFCLPSRIWSNITTTYFIPAIIFGKFRVICSSSASSPKSNSAKKIP